MSKSRLHVPRLLILLSALTVLCAILDRWLDRDRKDRPPENPYSVLRHLERDATLRSIHHVERASLGRLAENEVFFDFEPVPTPVEYAVTAGLPVAETATSLVPGGHSLAIAADGARLAIRAPALAGARALIVFGRLSTTAAQPFALRVSLDADWHRVEDTPQLTVSRQREPMRSAATLSRDSLEAGEWFDFRIALPVPPGLPADRQPEVLVDLFARQDLLVDHVGVALGTRLDGLWQGGRPFGEGVTEATRDLKRFVGGESDRRLSLLLPPPSALTLELVPRRRSLLSFGLGTLEESSLRGITEFTVAASRIGEFEETLLRIQIGADWPAGFRTYDVDLSAFAEAPVRLQFRITATEEAEGPVVVLGCPLISAPDPDISPTPHLVLASYVPDVVTEGTNLIGASQRFARIRTEGICFPRTVPPTGDRRVNLLSALAASPPTVPVDRQNSATLRIGEHAESLAERLRAHQFHCFAATREPGLGSILQGFGERSERRRGELSSAVLEWWDRQPERRRFVFLQLPARDPEREMDRLLQGLQSRGELAHTWVAVIPEIAPSALKGAPALLRLPGTTRSGLLDEQPVSLCDFTRALEFAVLQESGASPADAFLGAVAPPLAVLEDAVYAHHRDYVVRWPGDSRRLALLPEALPQSAQVLGPDGLPINGATTPAELWREAVLALDHSDLEWWGEYLPAYGELLSPTSYPGNIAEPESHR